MTTCGEGSPLTPVAILLWYPPTSQRGPLYDTPVSASALPLARVAIHTNLLFLSRLDLSVTAAQMHGQFTNDPISVLKARKIKPRLAPHSSFIFDVPKIDADSVVKLVCGARAYLLWIAANETETRMPSKQRKHYHKLSH